MSARWQRSAPKAWQFLAWAIVGPMLVAGIYGLFIGAPVGLFAGLVNAPALILVASRWPSPRPACLAAATTSGAVVLRVFGILSGDVAGVSIGAFVCACVAASVAPPSCVRQARRSDRLGIELYDGVDADNARAALDALEQLGLLVEVMDDLGPVTRRALQAKLRRTRKSSKKSDTTV